MNLVTKKRVKSCTTKAPLAKPPFRADATLSVRNTRDTLMSIALAFIVLTFLDEASLF
jgi:hypothetical protein